MPPEKKKTPAKESHGPCMRGGFGRGFRGGRGWSGASGRKRRLAWREAAYPHAYSRSYYEHIRSRMPDEAHPQE